jgi:hypothetical protein
MADSPPAWMGWFKGNSRLESMAFLTTTVGCFCVVGGWVTRSKQTQYSLLSTGIIIIPFLKKESKPYLKPSARRVHNIPRHISSL